MLETNTKFQKKVLSALLVQRQNFTGSDSSFAKQWKINPSVWSQLKNGKSTEGLLKDSKWLEIGQELTVSLSDRQWNPVKTQVFTIIEEDIKFCKNNAKSMMFVDECDIGKTFTAKYLSRTMTNCFYVDASQAKSKIQFMRLLAQKIGIDNGGKYAELKGLIKYTLRTLQDPVVIIDEAGDLNYNAFLDLKEMWNGTEYSCGWYMMGADGLQAKIEKGINSRKVGYREIFRRFNSRYSKAVPIGIQDKQQFYMKLISDVLNANIEDKAQIPSIVKKCLMHDSHGQFGGLSRAESFLILNAQ